ncbi:uncharacterized protein [Watersipora subatra]|uniref:uncharacterized protein n=1 Tax=Watersipora subatra TaxID=2589382 RepID=UPI00355C57B7
MGEKGYDIFETWEIEVDAMQYDNIKEKFDDYFSEKENIVATRHRLFTMKQDNCEDLCRFIERIERAAKQCRLEELEKDLILQVLIMGMNDDKMRKELLLKKNITLEKARARCSQYESATIAAGIITREKETIDQVIGEEEDDELIQRIGGRADGGARNKGNIGTGKSGVQCYTCDRFGHISKDCFRNRVTGYNRGYRGRNLTRGAGSLRKNDERSPITCYACSGTGHMARNCPNRLTDKKISMVENNASEYSEDSL